MLSKMLGVVETVPAGMLKVLGASKKIGRDKWLSLRQLILNPSHLNVAVDYVARNEFEHRCDAAFGYVCGIGKRQRRGMITIRAVCTDWL